MDPKQSAGTKLLKVMFFFTPRSLESRVSNLERLLLAMCHRWEVCGVEVRLSELEEQVQKKDFQTSLEEQVQKMDYQMDIFEKRLTHVEEYEMEQVDQHLKMLEVLVDLGVGT